MEFDESLLTGGERPSEVTSTNWPQLQQEGFKWLTNLTYPLKVDAWHYLNGVAQELGRQNVKLGQPCNKEGQPDANFYPGLSMIGVYARASTA